VSGATTHATASNDLALEQQPEMPSCRAHLAVQSRAARLRPHASEIGQAESTDEEKIRKASRARNSRYDRPMRPSSSNRA